MANYKELDVWKLSMDFVVRIYNITKKFPSDEKFGLISQMRRSAVSIPSNIAEGAGRNGVKENIQFLYISLGSMSELETQLILSDMLGFCDTKDELQELNDIKSKLLNLIKYFKTLK